MKKLLQIALSTLVIFALILPSTLTVDAQQAREESSSTGAFFQNGNTKISNAEVANTITFKDVPSNYWAKNEINFLVKHNIIKGYTNGKFGIKDPVTRVQAAIILARTLGIDKEAAPNPGFKDVPVSHPAYKEIAALVKYGIFSKSEYFNPYNVLKRAEMAKILTNAFDLKYAYITNFKDVKSGTWYYKFVQALAGTGVTKGNNGYFLPTNSTTRTEFSVFMARVLDPRFRSGLQASIENAAYLSDGRLKVDLTLYNNTNNRIFDIKGKYTLFVNNSVIAQSNTSSNSYPVKYSGLTIEPNKSKKVTFYFQKNEVKKRIDLSLIENGFLSYEHYWYYYK